jgi:hypothetical protein
MQDGRAYLGSGITGKMKVKDLGFFIHVWAGFIDPIFLYLEVGYIVRPMVGFLMPGKTCLSCTVMLGYHGSMPVRKTCMDTTEALGLKFRKFSTHRSTNRKSKTYKPTKPNLRKPSPKPASAWTPCISWCVRIKHSVGNSFQ